MTNTDVSTATPKPPPEGSLRWALQNVEEICRASPRMECVVFGMGDYSASQGIDIRAVGSETGYPGDIWHYPRFRMVERQISRRCEIHSVLKSLAHKKAT